MRIVSKEALSKVRGPARLKLGDKQLNQMMKIVHSEKGSTTVEIASADFAAAWYQRQRWELFSGRLEEPTLYQPIYNIISDPDLPKNVSIHSLGPGGVIFQEVQEGGEVKFATVGESEKSVRIRHYGVGLEYTKDLVMFNELWNVGIIEREAGRAYNALLNHIHLSPILTAAYGADNLTAASSDGTGREEHLLRTIEDAITEATEDTTNPRPGPYIALVSPADRFILERTLTRVPQQGFTRQSSAMDAISSLIPYNGWTGSMGKKSVTYSGVPTGTMFLIDTSRRSEHFQSFVKQDLLPQAGEQDMSRFILEQVIWDAYFGVYANPTAAVQKVTIPSS